jgi:putative N6-adenine-specific DNA methylase
MDNTLRRFFASCPRGLEAPLEQELRELGLTCGIMTDGGVGFEGTWHHMCRVNLESRIASRVLWEVGRACYRSEQDIYRAAYDIPWPDWFTPVQTIKVKVSARHCPLPSLDFVTLRIKDAVCDRFMATCRRRPSVDTQHPRIRIDAFLDTETVIFYLDTSGDPLFKRGYRQSTVDAPLRENLAAGLLRLAGWSPADPLLDPMCGGGTIALEAALIGRRIAPGLGRPFAFEDFSFHRAGTWNSIRDASRATQQARVQAPIHASDRDPRAVQIAWGVFQKAGVADDIRLTQEDVLAIDAPAPHGVIVINPPYGVRLSNPGELDGFYPQLGDRLKQRFAGWRAYIFTGDLRVPKLIGLAPSKRIPLFNGSLECRLYEFVIVSGSMRKKPLAGRSNGDPLTVS